MLAAKSVAEVSDGATGCTPSNLSYDIRHEPHSYTFWDTPGMNEDQSGTVSSKDAIQNLLNLVQEKDVSLLIYCIRGRLVDIIRVNYELVWEIICKKEVPIVLVVTGLEFENDMDDWWRRNESTLRKMKLSFAGHACITTTKGRKSIFQNKYDASAGKLWRLVEEHCQPEPWKMPTEWPSEAKAKVKKYLEDYYSASPVARLRRFFRDLRWRQ